ncbi:MAG TPA: ABC transporter ATP-binding protein/permease [Xanthobacteraceae bacterium]|nr:ABC transporter ATP-binding protein/permease [Xanthobacteraceae bacterium]
MRNILATLATIWRLAIPYFRSEDRWPGRILLAAVIAIELSIVGITVLINQWYNRFYNALQEKNWDQFVGELKYFSILVAIFVVLAVYQLYLNQWLQIRWRRWMTTQYLDGWMRDADHFRMQMMGQPADNPDQRISDDIKLFVNQTLSIGVGLLSSIVTLLSFAAILWGLSNTAPLHLFGSAIAIPGYLVWVALIYAIIGTAFTHFIGWPLVGLNFNQQRYEADFRFNLVRVRENGEQIALLKGEPAETERLLGRFRAIIDNWMAIMTRQKKLTFFTAAYSQASVVVPFIIASPAYFAGAMQLGGLMQTASAFDSVQKALSFFISAYRDLAEWRAVIDRLNGFEASIALARTAAHAQDAIHIAQAPQKNLSVENLSVALPQGRTLVAADHMSVQPGERVLVTGPSGAGKSTLFRAMSGIWPFGSGVVSVPAGADVMVLPQRPYFPVGSLAAAIVYPAAAETADYAKLAALLPAVGLPNFVDRLNEDGHWNQILSGGEQQRLGLIRALLQEPDFLFLDEATSSLDEPAEEALYRLLSERLASTAIVSIGHRSTLKAFHDRGLELSADRDAANDAPFTLHEPAAAQAAQ